MIPSRGLRPRQIVPLASRHSLAVRSGASRKFSSVPRKTVLSGSSCRTNTLQSANWRTGATSAPNVLVDASAVRYGSWYAPWTWGRSSTQPDASPTPTSPPSEIVAQPAAISETVTTATPELAPAGIGKPAVVESASAASDPRTVEDLLSAGPTPPVEPTATVDPSALISYWGNLKDLGLDYGWGTASFFESLIELTYLNTTLGWSGAILASSLMLRCMLFWFQRMGSDSMAKMAAMKPVLQPLMDQMEAAKRAGDEEKVNQLKLQQQAIMKEVGADMFKNLATPVMQGVFGWGAFRTLRGMSTLPVPGMSTDGLWWITDLTVSDPLYLLPAVTGGLMYLIMKMGGETGMAMETQQASMQKNMRIIMPLIMTGVTAYQPAAIQLYFVSSAALGGLTAWILRQPGARRVLGIRQLPTPESQQLYSKVVKGEIKLSAIRGADGKIRHQAPASSSPRSTTSSSPSINLRPGTALPPHMRKHTAKPDKATADRDVDYDAGMPTGWDVAAKWDWLKRNYNPRFVQRRLVKWASRDQRDATVRMEQERREKAKAASKKYEEERRRRFEGAR